VHSTLCIATGQHYSRRIQHDCVYRDDFLERAGTSQDELVKAGEKSFLPFGDDEMAAKKNSNGQAMNENSVLIEEAFTILRVLWIGRCPTG
jgi:hypothetical protein